MTRDIFWFTVLFLELVYYLMIHCSDIYLMSDGECAVRGAPYVERINDRPRFYHAVFKVL